MLEFSLDSCLDTMATGLWNAATDISVYVYVPIMKSLFSLYVVLLYTHIEL